MLRYFKLLIIALLSFIGVVACSSSDPEPGTPPTEKPGKPGEDDNDYEDKPIVGKNDVKLKIQSATVSEFNSSEGVEKAFDGNKSTIYHSKYKSAQNQNTFPTKPVVFEFTLATNAKDLDYIILFPRSSGDNGLILKGELFVKKDKMTDYKSKADVSFDFGEASNAARILNLPERAETPISIKLVITKGQNDYVSLAEIELYNQVPGNDYSQYYKYFKDQSCSELNSVYSRDQLSKIEEPFFRTLALKLYDKKYALEDRLLKAKTYPHPRGSKESAVMSFDYGIYDNATGICTKSGEHMTVFVHELTAPMTLVIVNPTESFNPKQSVPLRQGTNLFRATERGLIYLVYQSEQKHTAKVHIANGEINGLYDKSRHNPSQWNDLIQKAVYTHFDMLGDKVHVIFTTNHLRNINGPELLGIYDEIVQLGQDFTGMTKYKHIPQSRLCYIASNEASHMHATSNRTAFNLNTMPNISNPQLLKTTYLWGPVHETGHVHQVTPGMKWGSSYDDAANIIEVTNNLNCLYVQNLWKQRSRMEAQNDYEHAFKAYFVDKNKFGAALNESLYDSKTADMRLISFWQLQLYFGYALKNNDFYPDLHEQTRNTTYTSISLLLNSDAMNKFALNASKVSKHDLTTFFEDYGYPLSAAIKTQIVGLGYSKPTVELRYITDSNKQMYENGAAGIVKGNNAQIKEISGGYEINMIGWQNTVAFEVYNDANELIYASPNTKFSFSSAKQNLKIKAVAANTTRHDAGGLSN